MRLFIVFALTASLFALHVIALAEQPDAFETEITAELREKNPAAAETFTAANRAREADDLPRAERLYQAVRDQQPDFFHATRRQCSVVARLGRRDEAVALCRNALEASPSSVWNRYSLLAAILAVEDPRTLPDGELTEANELARGLLHDEELSGEYLPNLARTAVVTDDLFLLNQVVARMNKELPDEMPTHYYSWLAAMTNGDYEVARQSLEQARLAGLEEEDYQGMLSDTESIKPLWPGVADKA
jgi:tetratricopeptide (TPR) repeat protein